MKFNISRFKLTRQKIFALILSRKAFVVWLLTFINLPVFSSTGEDKLYCRDLAKYACLDGNHDEGHGLGKFPYPGEQKNAFIAQSILMTAQEFYSRALEKDSNFLKYTDTDQPCLFKGDICQNSRQLLIENLAQVAATEIIPWEYYLKLHPQQDESSLSRKINELKTFYHITTSAAFFQDLIKIKEKVNLKFSTRNYLDDMKAYLEYLKPILIRIVDSYLEKNSNAKLKKSIEEKVNSVIFSGDCGAGNSQRDTNSLFQNNLFYHPPSNTFKACSGVGIGNTSVFTMVFDIAHEMSHAISPCGIDIEYNGVDFFNYPSNSSVKDRIRKYPFNKVIHDLVESKISNLFGNLPDGSGSNPMCSYGGNVLDEAVADSFAIKVLVEFVKKYKTVIAQENYANGFSNTFRFACGTKFNVVSDHPSPEERLNKIILNEKAVRSLMRCKH